MNLRSSNIISLCIVITEAICLISLLRPVQVRAPLFLLSPLAAVGPRVDRFALAVKEAVATELAAAEDHRGGRGAAGY